jgi:hypothetical protein
VGAAETGAGQTVSDAMREQGSGWRAWATREHMGRPGKKRARPGPREQRRLGFKTNFQTEHDLISSKTIFILIKKFQVKHGVVENQTRNNFIHRKFSRFKMDFKVKF